MELGLIIGVIILICGILLWRISSEENSVFWGFIFSFIGIWLFLIFGFLSLFKRDILPFNFNFLWGIIIGTITGVIAGSTNLSFWTFEEVFQKNQTPEEGIGGAGLGCFGAIFSVVLGILIGALIGKFWG